MECESLEGEWGLVEAFRDKLKRSIELRLTGISRLKVDLDAAGIEREQVALRASSDVGCAIVLSRSGKEMTFRLTPGNDAQLTIKAGGSP